MITEKHKTFFIVTIFIIFISILGYLLVYSVILPRYQIIKFTYDTYEQSNEVLESIQEQIRSQLLDDFYSDISYFLKLEPLDRMGYFLDYDFANWDSLEEQMTNTVVLYYDCDINTFFCENNTFSSFEELKNRIMQLSNQKFKNNDIVDINILKNQNQELVLVFPPSVEDEKLILSYSLIDHIRTPNLSDLKITSELNQEYRSIIKIPFDFEMADTPKGYNKIMDDFYSGKTLNLLKDLVLSQTKLGYGLRNIWSKQRIMYDEEMEIYSNKINKTLFLDGSNNLEEHKKWLKNSITELQQELEFYPKQKENMLVFEDSYPELKSSSALAMKLIADTMDELGNELSELKANIYFDEIEKLENSLNVDETQESKVIRLRILQYFLAQELIDKKCQDNKECKFDIVYLTKQHNLCPYNDINCYIYLANYTGRSEICFKLDNLYDQEKCLESVSTMQFAEIKKII